MGIGVTSLIAGLTAGTNTFTLNYRVIGGGTLTALRRRISVESLL
jgi:hypothetical protein